jgi:hypothetical protein
VEAVSYEKIKKGHPFWELLQDAKRSGRWMCDSVDHNSDEGCSNPHCFKHPKSVTVSFPSLEDDES